MPESSVQELDELPPDAAIATDHRNPRRRNRQRQREEEPEVGILVNSNPSHELAGLILHRGVSRVERDRSRAPAVRGRAKGRSKTFSSSRTSQQRKAAHQGHPVPLSQAARWYSSMREPRLEFRGTSRTHTDLGGRELHDPAREIGRSGRPIKCKCRCRRSWRLMTSPLLSTRCMAPRPPSHREGCSFCAALRLGMGPPRCEPEGKSH